MTSKECIKTQDEEIGIRENLAFIMWRKECIFGVH